jgi:hypothetical protein
MREGPLSIATARATYLRDLVLRGNRAHMGNPGAEQILHSWIDDLIAPEHTR